MPGMVKQKIYITHVTPGITVTITKVEINNPDEGEWTARFDDNGSNPVKVPHEVDPSTDSGFIGTVYMENTKIGGGEGPNIKITFELSGQPTESETTSAPCSCAPENDATYKPATDGDEVDDPVSGSIIIHATKWGVATRPDYVMGEVQIEDQPNKHWEYELHHIGTMPPEAHLVITVDCKREQWGVHVDLTKGVTPTIIEYALNGIFYIHGKAFGWVLGKFNPLN